MWNKMKQMPAQIKEHVETLTKKGRNLENKIHIEWKIKNSNGTIDWDLNTIKEMKQKGKKEWSSFKEEAREQIKQWRNEHKAEWNQWLEEHKEAVQKWKQHKAERREKMEKKMQAWKERAQQRKQEMKKHWQEIKKDGKAEIKSIWSKFSDRVNKWLDKPSKKTEEKEIVEPEQITEPEAPVEIVEPEAPVETMEEEDHDDSVLDMVVSSQGRRLHHREGKHGHRGNRGHGNRHHGQRPQGGQRPHGGCPFMRMRMARRAEFIKHMKIAKCAKKAAVWCTIFKLIMALMLSCSTCKFMKALKAKDETEVTVSANHHYTYVQQVAPQ